MKLIKTYVVVVCFTLASLGCKESVKSVQVKDSKPIALFRYSNNSAPKISVHRGGKGLRHYPENCLETIAYVNDSISAVYEVDVAQTKDGILVLMHDNSIDRTTTGRGLVKNLTYSELQQFNLVDDYGNETGFKIPLFSEVLKFCKSRDIILTIDIKRSVDQKDVIAAVTEHHAQDVSIIITYDLQQALSAYRLAPELMLSVSARNDAELNRLLNSEIPTKNMFAFTGTRLSDTSLFDRIHDNDILCILGTLGNLDRQAQARGDHLYAKWLDQGIDMIATDRPFEVSKSISK